MAKISYVGWPESYERVDGDTASREKAGAVDQMSFLFNNSEVNVRFANNFMEDALSNRRRGETSPFDYITIEEQKDFVSQALDAVGGEQRRRRSNRDEHERGIQLGHLAPEYLEDLHTRMRRCILGIQGVSYETLVGFIKQYKAEGPEGMPRGRERL